MLHTNRLPLPYDICSINVWHTVHTYICWILHCHILGVLRYSHWSHARLTVLGRVVAKQSNIFKSVRFSGLGSWASFYRTKSWEHSYCTYGRHLTINFMTCCCEAPEYSEYLLKICWHSRIFADAHEYLLTINNICWRSRIFANAQEYLLTLNNICWRKNPTFQLKASHHAGRSMAGAHIPTVAKLRLERACWAGPSSKGSKFSLKKTPVAAPSENHLLGFKTFPLFLMKKPLILLQLHSSVHNLYCQAMEYVLCINW